jgi:hypothetical protein
MKGARKKCPRKKDRHPIWKLQLVLQSLRGRPFEPMLSSRLKWLTIKTAFLLAITTARRVGEIQALSVDDHFLRIDRDANGYPSGVFLKLNPHFIPKVDSDRNRESEIYLQSFCPRTNPQSRCTLFMCCPCRAIDRYVKATRAFRKTDQLLVCFANGPRKGQAASKLSISRWVRQAIQEAYKAQGLRPPNGIKAHSTRGQAASWAQFHNVAMSDICSSATWASDCTFATFYCLNLASTNTTRFANGVLQTVLDGRPT